MTVRFMARTLRGLEEVAAQEIEERGLGRVEHRRHREVWFSAASAEPRLLDLRTVDDLFLLVAVADGVGHTKADLAAFTRLARAAALPAALPARAACGVPGRPATVDVAASFLGRRNYNRYDIEDAVGRHAVAALGLRYHSRRSGEAPPEGGLSLRVTVEGTQATLAVRVADRPLHRRAYKRSSTPGTLHPPLAAALAWLAGIRPGMLVADPCCGTGTIPVEAAGLAPGAVLFGSDHDPETVGAAVANSAASGARVTWAVADAGRLPLRTGRVDRVVSNPPWDRQVQARGVLAGDSGRLFAELRRVTVDGGRAVLLLHEFADQADLARAAGFGVGDVRPVSLFGAHPSIVDLQG
ncbi:methyltransferase domain-containing protein [Micromonospora sp. KC207]|nr:methyltransferase domain-containing protein [Micromonospora sp. KC207]